MRSRIATLLTALVVAFGGSGCAGTTDGSSIPPSASGSLQPLASVTTLQPVWPQYIQLEWSVENTRESRKVSGYLFNRQGTPIEQVQILAQALDAGGAVLGQRIEWIVGVVPGNGRTSFSAAGLPPASSYRVSVWNFGYAERRR